MVTFGLVIAFVLVTLGALFALAIACALWFGISSARPEFLQKGRRARRDGE
jgi:hypothetical protein